MMSGKEKAVSPKGDRRAASSSGFRASGLPDCRSSAERRPYRPAKEVSDHVVFSLGLIIALLI